MKVKIRRSNQNDLDNIYDLHTNCFSQTDQWYKSAIKSYLDNGIIIELSNTNKIIGIMLQGFMKPCNKTFNIDNDNKKDYKDDIFEPINETGQLLFKKNIHFTDLFGIVMICIHPDYRGKGLGQKLIEKHFLDNKDKVICLNTRRSNINAYHLYKKMGYEHVAYIKNKYFLPTEDSIFMIKDLTDN